MNKQYEEIKAKALSAMRALSKDCARFDEARMLFGSADSSTSLTRSKVTKSIDVEWIEKIEAALPALDVIIRSPSVAIEDVDEVLPVELSRHITERSIKHLSQHTNYILDIKADGEVVPQKILNVFHEETALTYENKFVNTLLSRLSAFVDKRVRALSGTSGVEMNYRFGYTAELEHFASEEAGRNSARVELRVELTSPTSAAENPTDAEINERYKEALERIERINRALVGYASSAFAQKLGKNYVRPPVIRTNAILKNKDLRECLNLWEYIESYDKVGYTLVGDKYRELPSADFVGGMYSSAALQYLMLYSAIDGETGSRLMSHKHLFEAMPDFDDEFDNEDIEDYKVYDSEYRKTVPVSRLMNNRAKLSEDEKNMRRAIIVALRADEKLNEESLREELEERRLERERRKAEEEARRRAAREVVVRYRRSFRSRYVQAEAAVQDFYTEIKNLLLSYRGVRDRESFAKEAYTLGRRTVAKIDVRGKALYLYLALDPTSLESKYRAATASGGCATLMKIKSERKKKYAIELIKRLMSELGAESTERTEVDYRMPYLDNDALIEQGLIKLVAPRGVTLDENSIIIKDNFASIRTKKAKSADTLAPSGEETKEA